jgi:hypothetical protein
MLYVSLYISSHFGKARLPGVVFGSGKGPRVGSRTMKRQSPTPLPHLTRLCRETNVTGIPICSDYMEMGMALVFTDYVCRLPLGYCS